MPQYCLVKHHIVSAVIDGSDVGNEPDTLPISGDVTFYPILDRGDSVVVTAGAEKISYVLDPISARIVNGKISVDGEEGVKLFAGGPDSNPSRIRYRARFTGLNISGSKSIYLKDILFEAVPGGELTLSMAQPVPGAPYPGYSATIEKGIAQIEEARDEVLGQVSGAVAAEVDAIKWSKTATLLQGTEDLLTIREGWYRTEVAGATALGLPKTTAFDPPLQIGGFLLVLSRNTTRTLLWITGHNRPQLWVNNANHNGFTGWSFIGGVHNVDSMVVKGIISAADADALKSRAESGFYSVSGIGTNPTTATPPTNFSQVMLNASQADNGAQMQVAAATHPTDAGLYYRTAPAGSTRTFQMWQRVMAEGQSPTLNRSALMREELQEQWGGRIYTGDAVPVALTWDDFPRDFRDHVLPMLLDRGLPSTVALSSKMYDSALSPGIAPGAAGTTWAEINAWPENITIANHSATHTSATHRYVMYQEIVQARIDLQNSLPGKNILTWIQPSVTYDPQFNNGASGEAYASTIAGHMILGNHAFVTGSRRVNGQSGCYMHDGPMQGVARNWIDSGNGISNAKNTISAMRAAKRGIVIGAHADRFLRGDGFPSLSDLEGFLDWLVAEQAAGRVRVMNLEQFSIARYGSYP